MLKGWNVVKLALQHFNITTLQPFNITTTKKQGDYVLQKG